MRRAAVLGPIAALIVSSCAWWDPGPSGAAGTAALDEPGRHTIEIESAGTLRSAVVYVPDPLPEPAPLVIVFHGFMGTPGAVARQTAMHEIGDREGFITAYPAARGLLPAWRADRDAGDDGDVGFVRDLVAELGAELPVDHDRVYATGMSNGGGMVDRLACEAADLIAAAAPVAGAFSTGPCEPGRPVPIAAFHGSADWIVPFSGWEGVLPSIPEWAAGWADRNGCERPRSPRALGGDAAEYTWEDCAADVVLFVIGGGSHQWPGAHETRRDGTGTLSASETIWEFFSAQR
jgi:polyhydroxybutyrate depolymerase